MSSTLYKQLFIINDSVACWSSSSHVLCRLRLNLSNWPPVTRGFIHYFLSRTSRIKGTRVTNLSNCAKPVGFKFHPATSTQNKCFCRATIQKWLQEHIPCPTERSGSRRHFLQTEQRVTMRYLSHHLFLKKRAIKSSKKKGIWLHQGSKIQFELQSTGVVKSQDISQFPRKNSSP